MPNYNVFFTVIVAGYGTEKYLNKTIDSLIKQTFKNFEVFVIVEESPDKSLEIAQQAEKADSRFICISLPKSGSPASCWNYGIKNGKGKYILIVDGDDWLELDAFEKVYNRLTNLGDIDMLMFGAKEFNENRENGELKYSFSFCNLFENELPNVVSGLEMMEKKYQIRPKKLYAVVWLNAYKKSFLIDNELFFVDGMRFEDTEWIQKTWTNARSVGVLNAECVNHRNRPNSICTSDNMGMFCDFAMMLEKTFRYVLKNSEILPYNAQKLWISYLVSVYFWFFYNKCQNNSNRQIGNLILYKNFNLRDLWNISKRLNLIKRVIFILVYISNYSITDRIITFCFRKIYWRIILKKENHKE